MTVYIQNGTTFQSIADTAPVPANWTAVTLAAAQAGNPQLFGTADPKVLHCELSHRRFTQGDAGANWPAADPATQKVRLPNGTLLT